MKTSLYLKKLFISSTFFSVLCLAAITEAQVIEDVIVTAEKRSESVQDISQSVTAITEDDLDAKNINSFVDLSAIVPGVTVAKNEGYKTVISIRGVGNETNQNAIAAPSVAFHMDGIFIASPFSLQTDFIDVEHKRCKIRCKTLKNSDFLQNFQQKSENVSRKFAQILKLERCKVLQIL